MSEIILARHGETEWNQAEVFRGRNDVPLNQNGIRQAELLAGYLKAAHPQAIYASPVRRAVQTAEIIARASGLAVVISDGLTDLDFGDWEGIPQAQVKNDPIFRQWQEHPELVRMPGGESLDDVRRRALPVVEGLVKKHDGRVVVVSHRVVIKVLICALLGLDNSRFWNIKSDTGAITIFSYEKRGFALDRHNESCYLSDARANLIDF